MGNDANACHKRNLPTANHFMASIIHLLVFVASAIEAGAFYLPGAAPHNFIQGEPVPLYVNALTPMLTAHAGKEDAKLKSLINCALFCLMRLHKAN